ncbi:MAG: prolyl oligopeptidase family serine peptidase, partial [Rhodothermales bacterium]
EIVVDEASGSIYYTAAPGDPTRRYLYRVPIDGSSPAVRITPEVPGTHTYQIAPGGAWAIHTFSTFDTPSVIDLVSLPNHETHRVLMSNETLRRRLAALQLPKLEFFRVDIGDTELDGWVMKPTDFDPSKKYPVLFYVYGEAANQTVKDAWPGERGLWHRLLTDLGVVVVSVDNRGTPSPRGRAWRKFGYGSIGYQSSADQAKAAREIRKWPFIDSTRVGVWGWSGGGTSTLNAMFRYPEVYDVGIAVAPVTDRRYYDTIYQERYMGLPQDNPEGYRLGSPISFAQRLEGDLLLIHGTGDDNVHYQNSEALINRLVEYNKLFSFMSYPNRTHSISEGVGTKRHLYGTMTRYLMDKLLPAR